MGNITKHEYRWNGTVALSVTQILEKVGIIDYQHLPNSIRTIALERGSAVHAACHYADEGDLVEDRLGELLPYVNAWRRFRSDTQFVPDLIEHRAFNESYGFAGTLDRRGASPNWKLPVIIDLKTNEAPRWTGYQLAAYASFFPSPRAYMRLAVELHKNETYRVDEYHPKDWHSDFAVFASALCVVRARDLCNPKSEARVA